MSNLDLIVAVARCQGIARATGDAGTRLRSIFARLSGSRDPKFFRAAASDASALSRSTGIGAATRLRAGFVATAASLTDAPRSERAWLDEIARRLGPTARNERMSPSPQGAPSVMADHVQRA